MRPLLRVLLAPLAMAALACPAREPSNPQYASLLRASLDDSRRKCANVCALLQQCRSPEWRPLCERDCLEAYPATSHCLNCVHGLSMCSEVAEVGSETCEVCAGEAPECVSDGDCPVAGTYCNDGYCAWEAECALDDDCLEGEICFDDICEERECSADGDCSGLEICDGGRCYNVGRCGSDSDCREAERCGPGGYCEWEGAGG